MNIDVSAAYPTDLLLNDVCKSLTVGPYYVAAVELGHDKTNGGYTVGQAAFGDVCLQEKHETYTKVKECFECGHILRKPYSFSTPQVIVVKFTNLDDFLQEPGVIALFLSKDNKTFQIYDLCGYKKEFIIYHEPLRSHPCFSRNALELLIPDRLLGDRSPQPGEWNPTVIDGLVSRFTMKTRITYDPYSYTYTTKSFPREIK